MKTKTLLATAAIITILAIGSARAEDAQQPSMVDNAKVGFSQAIKDIQGWFGDDTPSIEPAAGTPEEGVAAGDEYLQVPTPVDPSVIEPAAGAFDDDVLQVPPPYLGPDAVTPDMTPRASAFDNMPSTTAFGEQAPTPEEIAGIAPAAGEAATEAAATAAAETSECDALITQAENAPEGDTTIDTAKIEACLKAKSETAAVPVESDMPAEPKSPAQPAFEETPMPATPEALPETQPASGL